MLRVIIGLSVLLVVQLVESQVCDRNNDGVVTVNSDCEICICECDPITNACANTCVDWFTTNNMQVILIQEYCQLAPDVCVYI